MTNFEAFARLEQEVLALNLIDPTTKEKIKEPMISLGIVSAHFSAEWETVATALAEKQIDADEYYKQTSRMIREFGDEKTMLRIEQELLSVYEHQGMFPLTRQGKLV